MAKGLVASEPEVRGEKDGMPGLLELAAPVTAGVTVGNDTLSQQRNRAYRTITTRCIL